MEEHMKRKIAFMLVFAMIASMLIPVATAAEGEAGAAIYSGTVPSVLIGLLEENDVVRLQTPGSGGYGVSKNATLVIPAGTTLIVDTILNVRRGSEIIVEGTLIVSASGRINIEGGTAEAATGGVIVVSVGGLFINEGSSANVESIAGVRDSGAAGGRITVYGEYVGERPKARTNGAGTEAIFEVFSDVAY